MECCGLRCNRACRLRLAIPLADAADAQNGMPFILRRRSLPSVAKGVNSSLIAHCPLVSSKMPIEVTGSKLAKNTPNTRDESEHNFQ